MKQILKELCNQSLYEIYKENLLSTFNSFFVYDRGLEKKSSILNLAKNVFESFVSSDFNVKKYIFDTNAIEEIYRHPIVGGYSGNADTEVTIYHIFERKLNIVCCDENLVFYIGYSKLLELIEENYSVIYDRSEEKYNNASFEFLLESESIIYTPCDCLTNGEYYEEKCKCEYNLIGALIELYGENDKTQNYKKILQKYLIELDKVINMTLNELYDKNKNDFLNITINELINMTSLKLLEKDKQIVYNVLYNHKDIDKIIKLIFTFKYAVQANKLLKYKSESRLRLSFDFLDYTFVAVQMFKLVEIVFYGLLKDYWSSTNIKDKYGTINLENDNINLGKMNQFFKSDDPFIVNHLSNRKEYNDILNEKLSNWIQKTRNGFLHKHILSYDEVEQSISDSIDITILLVLVLIR